MTSRERRALLVGGAIIALALALRLGSGAVRIARARLEAAREASALALRARRLVAEAPGRQRVLQARARLIVELAPVLLSGSTEAEAGAALAGELNALAMRHRVAITRLDPLPDSASQGFTKVEVRLHAESDLPGLYGFVYAVETGPLLLSFSDLVIAVEDANAPVERLRVEASVRGWMVKGAGAPPERREGQQ